MRVSIIAAVAENKVIGKDNQLIWHLPKDLKFFKMTTDGHPVIMGRKNYDSIPEKFKPLPNRKNIVITRQEKFEAPGAEIHHSLEDSLKNTGSNDEAFIIGGEQIYQLALNENRVNRMYITHIHESFDGDTFFPEFEASQWNRKIIQEERADSKNPYSFTICQYDKP